MKIIESLELSNGNVIRSGDKLRDAEGKEVHVRLSKEDPASYPVLLSVICFVPQLEITDDDDDIQSTPAHYQLLYWIILPKKQDAPDGTFNGLPFGTVEVVWLKDVTRVRETWIKEDVAVATAEWFNSENDEPDEEEQAAQPPNGSQVDPPVQSATT